MTQPAAEDRLSAAQLAALLTLVQAQAAVRQQLSQTAVAAAMAAFQAIGNWWSSDDVGGAISSALRIIQPTQRQAAQITSSFVAQTARVISGATPVTTAAGTATAQRGDSGTSSRAARAIRTASTIDIKQLRRAMTEDEADDLLDGIVVPAWLILGDSHDGPADTIDDDAGLIEAAKPQWLDAEDPYGRVADAYRFNITMRGDSPEIAAAKAIARVAAIAETDVTLAVRAQYQASMSAAGAIGFRRILHPELSETGPCALCVVAADRMYRIEDLLPIHAHCVCEVLPVYAGADPGITLNGDDLQALYDAAGGNTRQALRRVTVALAEHAELGPILVDANQQFRGPVDYARQKTSRSKEKYAAQLESLEELYEITKYRVSRGDHLEKTLADQSRRLTQLRRLAGVS